MTNDCIPGHSAPDKQAQQMGLTEQGLQRLRDTADTAVPHRYDWYVLEAYNTPEEAFINGLSLEAAIRRYTASESASKRLGVTKDDIAAVDLVFLQEGREWLSRDRLRLDSFRTDAVVAEAADRLRRMLNDSPAVGRVTFVSGEQWNFTDGQKYLQTIREELPYQSTTGFRFETLTDAPEIRKAADDLICDLYGEENPQRLEDYGRSGLVMHGLGQASGTISLTLVTGTGSCPLALPASDERLEEVRSFLGLEDFAEAAIRDIRFSVPQLTDLIPLDTITAEDANALALCLQEMEQEELLTFCAALEAEQPEAFSKALAIAMDVDDYEIVPEDAEEYGRQVLRRIGADDEIIDTIDGFMDFAGLGEVFMEEDCLQQTSFGPVRRLSRPFPQQEMGEESGMQML